LEKLELKNLITSPSIPILNNLQTILCFLYSASSAPLRFHKKYWSATQIEILKEKKMLNFLKSFLSFNPLRIRIPSLLDIVVVSDPEQIKKIEDSGNVDRLHAYDTASLPWWVKFYFPATKFHDDERDLWFCPFESASNPTYLPRRAYLEEKVATSYSQEDVKRIAELLNTNTSDEVLAHEMVQVVNRRFFEEDIPLAITKASNNTLQKLSEAILPWKYINAKKSQKQIMDYCAAKLPQNVHILDVGHNIGEVVQATAGALRRLKENRDKSVEEIFTTYAPTPQVPRIAIKSSDFDGLLSFPTTPGKTVIIMKVGEAAAKTRDLNFTFSAGTEKRACVFKEFFLNFMSDLQKELN
jgi:hypothetical protein